MSCGWGGCPQMGGFGVIWVGSTFNQQSCTLGLESLQGRCKLIVLKQTTQTTQPNKQK